MSLAMNYKGLVIYMGDYRVEDNSRVKELYHHGVKGQQWGVRRGPPYPIEDTVLKAGTKLNSVSRIPNSKAASEFYRNTGLPLYTYRKDEEYDTKVYKGPFSYGQMLATGMYMYEHQYEVVKDLKMPTSKERIDAFIEQYNSDKRITAKNLETYRKAVLKSGVPTDWSEAAKVVKPKKLQTKEDYEAAYEIFVRSMEMAYRFKSTKKYLETMRQKYDAMVDDNDQGIYNGAHDPIIILKASEALRECGNLKIPQHIDPKEVMKNTDELADLLRRQGKKVAF